MELETIMHEDLVYEIFLHLPVKSLARFKCISKYWNTLISGRRFTKTLLERYPEPNTTLFLCWTIKGMKFPRHNADINVSYIDGFKPQPLPPKLEESRVVVACHGLIFFSNFRHTTACVWNPVTNQLRTFNFQHLSFDVLSFIGFGYDTINDDYKVVRIIAGESDDDQAYDLTIEIFEVRNMESRRVIILPANQVPFLFSSVSPVTVNGSSHWIAFHPKKKLLQIVRFDMDHEKFVEIPFSIDMPNINSFDVEVGANLRTRRRINTGLTPRLLAWAERLVNNNNDFRLGVVKGSLCLFITNFLKMEAWLMNSKNQDGSDVVWTRLFEIPLSHETFGEVIGSTANDEVLISTIYNKFVYDPWKKKYLNVQLKCQYPDDIHQAVAYVESLVNVHPQ